MNTIELLRALADETRLRIVSLLAEAGDLCSCEIEALLDLRQSNTSRHLARLRQAGVLEARKLAQWMHYRIAEPDASSASLVTEVVRAGRSTMPALRRDLRRLSDYRHTGHSCETIRQWQANAARSVSVHETTIKEQ
jgi:ArsR family transcriptional regulator, arsenate/arsenite/antimonite-responsive transcriptional repressor